MPDPSSKQAQAAPEVDGLEVSGVALAAVPAPRHPCTGMAAPAERVHASVAVPSEQKASASSSAPANAAVILQSREAEATPAPDKALPWRSPELRVAAALLVVLQRAMKEGHDAFIATKEILTSNDPRISLFLQLLPEDGKLPNLKQLEGSASAALDHWLRSTRALCASAECQALELFTRSALCSTHLRATRSVGSAEFAARRQRLQAIRTRLPVSSTALVTRMESLIAICDRARLLDQHSIAPKTQALITVVLRETILLLDADHKQLGAPPLTAGSGSSFTVCMDHMLPGVGAAWQSHLYLLSLQ